MIQYIRKIIGIVSALALMLLAPDALAGMGGGTISYSPYAQNVPALSEAMLVVLALLFAVLAFRVLRSHPGGKPLASLLALGVLALAATSGNQLIKYAQAVDPVFGYFSNPNGGVVDVPTASEVRIQNSSGRAQQVTAVTPYFYSSVYVTSGSPQCTTGLVVQNSNSCYVHFGPTPP